VRADAAIVAEQQDEADTLFRHGDLAKQIQLSAALPAPASAA
jgi:hypothetical protein